MALYDDDAAQELDSPIGITGLNRGGSVVNHSASGPGIWYQASVGAPVTVTGNPHLFNFINVKAPPYNAAGDGTTDDTDAFDAVIAYVNANGSIGSGGKETTRFVIFVPDGVYSIPNGLSNAIAVDNVWWYGASPDGFMVKGQTGTLFKWGGSSQIYGGGMKNVKFYYTAADTGALCLDVYNAAHLSFEGIRLRDCGKFAKLGDLAASKTTNSTRFRDVMGYVKNLGVPTFDLQNGAGFYLNGSTVNTNGVSVPVGTDAHTAVAGQTLVNAQGGWDTAMITDVNCIGYYYNLYVNPSTGKHIRNWYVTSSFFDYSAQGIVLRAVNGNVRNFAFSSVWSTATDGDSFRLEGNGATLLQNVNFVSCIAIISGRHGWNIEKGDRVTIDDGCESIGQGRLTTGYGVYLNSDAIAQLVQNISVIGGRHGIDGAPISSYSPLQADYGVKVNASALRYTVRNVRADGITAPFSFADPSAQASSCIVTQNRRDDGAKPAYATSAAIVVPASTVAYTNTSPFTKHYYISGGTVSEIKKGSTVVSTGTNMFVELRPGESWTITYASVPQVVEDIVP